MVQPCGGALGSRFQYISQDLSPPIRALQRCASWHLGLQKPWCGPAVWGNPGKQVPVCLEGSEPLSSLYEGMRLQ